MRIRLGAVRVAVHVGVLVVALAAACGVARAAGADEVIDRVLAVAAGELITQSDVMAARDLGLSAALPVGAASASQTSGDDTRPIVSRLIDRALMLAEVDRYAPPEPAADAVDREVAIVRARFASDAAFKTALARVGFDDAYLRGYLRQDLRIRAYIDQRFAGTAEERDRLVTEWVTGLRRRATVTELDLTAR
jgi:hypothetical protein